MERPDWEAIRNLCKFAAETCETAKRAFTNAVHKPGIERGASRPGESLAELCEFITAKA